MTQLRDIIVTNWFRFFIGSFLVLFLLLTIANLISGFLRMNVTAWEVIANHLLEVPGYLKLITPVSCMTASLFAINKLKNTNELTAIFASGYKRSRFFLDIVMCAVIVASAQFLINAFVQPYAKASRHLLIKDGATKFRNLKSKGLMASTIASGRMWFKSKDYIFSFSTFDKKNLVISDVSIYSYNKDHYITSIVHSPTLKYIENEWIATKMEKISGFSNSKFQKVTKDNMVPIDIIQKPKDFSQLESDITTLNIFKLWSYISKLQSNGINVNEYLVVFYNSFSSSIICIVFSLFASFGAFYPNRRGSAFGKNITLVLVFVIMYWLVNSYFLELGKSSKVNPLISTLGVPTFFVFIIAYFFIRNRKLT